jgi:hypothetical protein
VVVQAGWFAAASIVAFLIPYVGVSVLELQHDLFYAFYFAVALAGLGAWARLEHVDVRAAFRRGRAWSVAIGVVLGALLVVNVLNADATPRPDGAYFAFELLWRGVGYGIVDALLLTAFPCAVAYRMLRGRIDGIRGRLRFAALTVPLVVVITATYHLGYPQYREDGLARPEMGNLLISIPALATANPLGSVVAHVAQHVTAVTHAYESEIYCPPTTQA